MREKGFNMNESIKNELLHHIIDTIEQNDLQDFEYLHQLCFNEDYYIIGYYQAAEWLKNHDVCPFECIEYVQDYEKSNFGEVYTKINSESMVNMYVYILGEELINKFDIYKSKEELLMELREEL